MKISQQRHKAEKKMRETSRHVTITKHKVRERERERGDNGYFDWSKLFSQWLPFVLKRQIDARLIVCFLCWLSNVSTCVCRRRFQSRKTNERTGRRAKNTFLSFRHLIGWTSGGPVFFRCCCFDLCLTFFENKIIQRFDLKRNEQSEIDVKVAEKTLTTLILCFHRISKW